MSGLTHQTPYLVEEICESGLQIGYYSRLTIELRQVFLAMKLFQAKSISSLFKITISSSWGKPCIFCLFSILLRTYAVPLYVGHKFVFLKILPLELVPLPKSYYFSSFYFMPLLNFFKN